MASPTTVPTRMVMGYKIEAGAKLAGAKLVGANLTNANLRLAKLRDADLTFVVWNGTICPDRSTASSPSSCHA